jgi:hypothetical protein
MAGHSTEELWSSRYYGRYRGKYYYILRGGTGTMQIRKQTYSRTMKFSILSLEEVN